MQTYEDTCPVCGGNARYSTVTENFGTVEAYGNCENCSYILRMCYSPTFQAICDEEPSERIERARAMKIEVLSREEYECAL